MRYAAIGIKGKKNCLVIGRSNDDSSSVAMAVLPIGPGVSIMLKQNTPRIAINTHCPSSTDHLCACSALNVSMGEKEVCREANELAGDCRLRSLLRSLRRRRCGTRSCNDFHGIFTVVFGDELVGCIAPSGACYRCQKRCKERQRRNGCQDTRARGSCASIFDVSCFGKRRKT